MTKKQVIEKIKNMRESGKSNGAIARHLNANKIRNYTTSTGTPWNDKTVSLFALKNGCAPMRSRRVGHTKSMSMQVTRTQLNLDPCDDKVAIYTQILESNLTSQQKAEAVKAISQF